METAGINTDRVKALVAAREKAAENYQILVMDQPEETEAQAEYWKTLVNLIPISKESLVASAPKKNKIKHTPRDHSEECPGVIAQCDTILEKCGELLEDDSLPETAHTFAEDVTRTVNSIREYATAVGDITDGQQLALDNMEVGADRWLH